jgi:hypothetical protein
MTSLAQVINHLYSGSEYTLEGDTYAGLTWHSSTPKPSEKELEDARDSVGAQIAKDEAAREAARVAILARIGLTLEELKLILP